ncbi:hypothetical protein D3C86_1431330 [compost metagenome]
MACAKLPPGSMRNARTRGRVALAVTAFRSRIMARMPSVTAWLEASRNSGSSANRSRINSRSPSRRLPSLVTESLTASRRRAPRTAAPNSSAAIRPKSNQSVATEYSPSSLSNSLAWSADAPPTLGAAPSRPAIRSDHSNPLSRKSPRPSGPQNTDAVVSERCKVPSECRIDRPSAILSRPSQRGLRRLTSPRF